MVKAVVNMTDRELARELDHIARIADRGVIGQMNARARTAAVCRGAARRLRHHAKKQTSDKGETDVG